MRQSTGDFDDIIESFNESWHVTDGPFEISDAQLAIWIVTHRVNISFVSSHKTGMFFAAANAFNYDVETAEFGQMMNHFLISDPQLPIVII